MALVRIFCSDNLKYILALSFLSSLAACSGGGGGPTGFGSNPFMLSWDAPAERMDGAILESKEIAGYRVYYGVESGVYLGRIDIVGAVTQTQVSGVPSGKYFVVMTTIDTNGLESVYSNPEVEVIF